MSRPTPSFLLRLCRCVIELAGGLVPEAPRSDWKREWRAEVHSHWLELHRRGAPDAREKLALLGRCLGAIPDALSLLHQEWSADTMLQDLRYAMRTYLKRPGFTAIAVLTLALGIGANTAIFSVVDTVLLRALPYPDPDRLVQLWHRYDTLEQANVSPPGFVDYRDQTRAFEAIAAISPRNYNLSTPDGPERIPGARVSAAFFDVLATAPTVGRGFLPGEDQSGKDQVVVLSHGLWARRFGSDRSVLGQQVTLSGQSYQIVGVAPQGFRFGKSELWSPLAFTPGDLAEDERGHEYLDVIARLKPGVGLQQAQAELDTVATRLRQKATDDYLTNSGWGVRVGSMHESIVGSVRPVLLVLLGAVGFLLLIACANVGSLLLSRAAAREREMALRTALGAGQSRLVRQLLTESAVLSLMGGGLGLALAVWGTEALRRLALDRVPRLDELALDGRIFAFTLIVSLLTAVVFGLVPALRVSRTGLNDSLKEGGRGHSTGVRSRRLRSALVVGEVAMALVLLVGSGLMIRSFGRLLEVEPGFRPENLLTLELSTLATRYPETRQLAAYHDRVLERVSALPLVEAAGMTVILPLSGDNWTQSFLVPDQPPVPGAPPPGGEVRIVTPGFFQTMGIPLMRGRDFSDADTADAPRSMVVDEALAARFWPNADPLGKTIQLDETNPASKSTIVGVVRSVKSERLDAPSNLQFYLTSKQVRSLPATRSMILAIRTTGDPASLAPAVRREIQTLEPEQPIYNVRTMEDVVARSIARPRFSMLLLGLFAGVALLLAAVGLYGVLADAVTQRTHEIGVRMALGAQRRDVLRLVVGQGMLLAGVGLALGLAGAFALSRLIEGLLFGVRPTDPLTFLAVAALLAAVALLASYLPARKATAIQPLDALRHE